MKSNRWKIIAAAVLVAAAGFCYIRGEGNADLAADGILLPVQESSADRSEERYEQGETGKDVQPTGNRDEDITEGMDPPEETGELPENDNPASRKAENAGIWVHVCGEVRLPGVYELTPGSRVYQAVEAAGGFTEEAGRDYLNMAQTLEDGMKLVIPDLETAQRLSKERESGAFEQEAEAGIFPAVPSSGGVKPQGGAAAQGTSLKVNLNTATREELMTLKGIGGSRADDIIAYRETHGAFQTIEDIMKVSGIKEASFEKIKEDITV